MNNWNDYGNLKKMKEENDLNLMRDIYSSPREFEEHTHTVSMASRLAIHWEEESFWRMKYKQ